MLYYRIDNQNNIVDFANEKYSDDCLTTEKNIVRSFDGKLIFEEEASKTEYIDKEKQYNNLLNLQKEHTELVSWFDIVYSRAEQKYRRLNTLGLLCDDNTRPQDKLIDLYNLAETKRKRIQVIEEMLNAKQN